MAVTKYKIKKWTKMLSGKSVLHVQQGVGMYYEKNRIEGYYNDLTKKVLKDNVTLDGELPKYPGEDGVNKIFPIGVFQYGLGAYDLYLGTGEKKYLNKFKMCVDWTATHQDGNGGWKTFAYETPEAPYSAMAQGEAISLLARANKYYGNKKYLDLMKKGVAFLMTSVNDGGVSLYDNGRIYLKEYMNKPIVLNGWIFSVFGLHDYLIVFPKDKNVKDFYNKTIETLKETLPEYDLGYWSKYDLNKNIASPFYHDLHIAQLNVLYELSDIDDFKEYANKFSGYTRNKFYKLRAFINKVVQKIRE